MKNKRIRRRVIGLFLVFIMLGNMCPVFALPGGIALGDGKWVEHDRVGLSSVSKMISVNSNMYQIGIISGVINYKQSYDGNYWSGSSLNLNADSIDYYENVGTSDNYIGYTDSGVHKLVYQSGGTTYSVDANLESKVVAVMQIQELTYNYSTSTPGIILVALENGTLLKYEASRSYRYSSTRTYISTASYSGYVPDGISDMVLSSGKYIILDSNGVVYTNTDLNGSSVNDSSWVSSTLTYNPDQMLQVGLNQYFASSEGGAFHIEKGTYGDPYTKSVIATDTTDVSLSEFSLVNGSYVGVGRNNATGKSYGVISDDGSTWEYEGVYNADGSESTSNFVDVVYNTNQQNYYAVASDGKLFTHVALQQATTGEIGNLLDKSATISGSFEGSPNSVTEKGFELTLLADTDYSSATKVPSVSASNDYMFMYMPVQSTNDLEATLTNLQPNTDYRVRAYVVNQAGTTYGSSVTFTTKNTLGLAAIPEESMQEFNMDGLSIVVDVTSDTFADSTIDPANVTLKDFPAGITVNSVEYIDSNSIVLVLDYDSENYNISTGKHTVSIVIDALELSSGQDLESQDLTLQGLYENPAVLVNGLGGSAGFGEEVLEQTDDYYKSFDIRSVFPDGFKFGSSTYNYMHVNINGAIHFGDADLNFGSDSNHDATYNGTFDNYTPVSIAVVDYPTIAGFWTDILNTRGVQTPSVEYDEFGNVVGHSTGSNDVFIDLDEENKIVTVTWDDVTHINAAQTGTAAFQIRLHNLGDNNVSIEMIYENIDYAGSTPARMGWSTGENPSPAGTDGVDYYEFPASGDENKILDLTETRSASGEVGVYRSDVVDGAITPVYSDNNNLSALSADAGALAPTFNSAITGYSIEVGAEVSTIALTPTIDHSEATMTVDGTAADSGSINVIDLSPGLNEIPIVVTAEDDTTKTYTVSVIVGTPVEYSVDFDTQGGIPVSGKSVQDGASFSQPSATTRDGYTFDGWYKEASYATEWDFNSDTVSGDMTLYAKWIPEEYTVNYDGNGVTTGVPEDTALYNYGQNAVLMTADDIIAPSGKRFNGWNLRADGQGDHYDTSQVVEMSGDLVLYAEWLRLPPLSISYDANGADSGSVPTNSNTYYEDVQITVPDNTNLAKAGYTFVGWNTSSDGQGSSYQPGQKYKFGENSVTLYANWTALPTYTVTYDGNGFEGGLVPTDGKVYYAGQSVTTLEKSTYLTRTDYTFTGWNTASDGSGTHYDLGDTFQMPDGPLTLYADWDYTPSFRLTYDGNGNDGGEVPLDRNDYLVDASIVILSNPGQLTKTGYKLTGWNTASNGSGSSYTAGETASMVDGGLTLYAEWEALPTYNVTYHGNGSESGSVPTDNNDYYDTSSVVIQSNANGLYKYGYEFAGWNSSSSSQGTTYNIGSTIEMGSADRDLYAMWSPLPRYSVTYDANGAESGTVPIDQVTYLADENATILGNENNLTRTGYEFVGWNESPDGSGGAFTRGAQRTMHDADFTLYAQWSALPTYTVTYYSNGAENGSVPVDQDEYLEGSTVNIHKNTGHLIRYGYELIGWNTDSSPNSTLYGLDEDILMGGSDLNLYAAWSALPTYHISYDGNGNESGADPEDDIPYLEGENVKVAQKPANMKRYGYDFAGWNTESDGSGTTYDEGALITFAQEDVSLYGEWTALPSYSITYDGNGADSGIVPVDNNTYLEGETFTVLNNSGALALTGYMFDGWNTAADGSGTNIEAGLTDEMLDSDFTLYAQWKIGPRYFVTYDGNGFDAGREPLDHNGYIQETEAVVLGNSRGMEHTGYTFDGWNTSSDGTGTAYVAGAMLPVLNEDTVLYAQWSPNTYTLSYNPVHNVTSPAAVTVAYGTLLQKPTEPDNPDYILTGWYYDEALTNPVDFTADTMPAEDLVLYAAWMDSDYTLSFDDGYNLTTPSAIEVTYGESLYEPVNPDRAGYTFSGWYYDEARTHSVSFTTDTMPSHDVTLYAKWGVNPYTITYSTGVDVTSPSAAMADFDTLIPEPTPPEKEGYSFGGWYYDMGYANAVNFEADTMPANDLTLYAEWQINAYTLTLDYGYDTTTPAAITVTFGDSVDLDTPSRSGYSFGGWYKDSNFASIWDSNTDTMPASDMTLYAKWVFITDVDLTDLDVRTYGLDETFSAALTSYHVSGVTQSQIDIRAYVAPNKYSTVTVNGSPVDADGWITVNLVNGTNNFNVVVTAQDGISTKTYTLNVYKVNELAVLESITGVGGYEVRNFNSNVYTYDLGQTSLSQISVGAKAYSDKSLDRIEINGAPLASGSTKNITLSYGTNTIEVYVLAEDGVTESTYILTIERLRPSSGKDRKDTGTTTDTETEDKNADSGVTVIVNGKEKNAGTKTIVEAEGRKAARVDVVRESIEKEIMDALEETAGIDNTIEVPVDDEDLDDVQIGLTGDIIKMMEDNAFDLSISTRDAGYNIPAKEFEIVNVAKILNVEETDLVDIKVNVSIEKVSETERSLIQDGLGSKINMLSTPIAFKVEATATDRGGNTQTVEVKKFSEFVKRNIVLPEVADPSQITTAVLYDEDGSFRHIPTEIEKVGDQYVAVINSLTNSVYTVIWNEVDFEDVKGHWSEEVVNDLGARLVVTGKTETEFDPDGAVTRAEFATMVVQGLGVLRTNQQIEIYSDVTDSDWYAKAITTAKTYELISGYPDGSFEPENSITREEAFAVAYSAMKLAGYTPGNQRAELLLSQYEDSDAVSDWAADATAKLLVSSVVSGYDGKLMPQASITRAEAAVLIRNILVENALINE